MEGIPPISPDLDEDLTAMRIGKALGIPAREVMEQPAHWLGAATVKFEVDRIEYEKANKRSRRGGGKPMANPRSKRG